MRKDDQLSSYLDGLRPIGEIHGTLPVVAAVARRLVVESSSLDLAEFAGLRLGGQEAPADLVAPLPADLQRPDVLGWVYESLLDLGDRHRRGVYFTPPSIADGLVKLALTDLDIGLGPSSRDDPGPTICDPAMGGGAFLLAAARALEARGHGRAQIVSELLWGIDIDPGAVAVAEAALALWAGSVSPETAGHLITADALDIDASCGTAVGSGSWMEGRELFQVVVGNPPFQNQLGSGTTRDRVTAARLVERFGVAAKGYVDTSALFLLLGCALVRPNGRVALIQPQSVLGAQQTAAARDALLSRSAITSLWWNSDSIFDAKVRVCGLVLELGALQGRVSRYVGPEFQPAGAGDLVADPAGSFSTWGSLLGGIGNRPSVRIEGVGTLGDWCSATAGFRDQFYGLVPHVVDRPDGLGSHERPLITTAHIDPLNCVWGRRPVRFAGVRWAGPAVDLSSLRADPKLSSWVDDRLVPKVLVATQSRVIEAIVDETGALIPSVPVIAVTSDPDRLWHLAAALLSPALSAHALVHHAGAALSEDAIKLSARGILALPSPVPGPDWDQAASLLEALGREPFVDPETHRSILLAAARAMSRAFVGVGAEGELESWWADRLPAVVDMATATIM